MAHPASRERRWLLLVEDGSHTWMGRASDPLKTEIMAVEAALAGAGKGGYLAVSEGDYWSGEAMTLLQVRDLNRPRRTFDEAKEAFLARRIDQNRTA